MVASKLGYHGLLRSTYEVRSTAGGASGVAESNVGMHSAGGAGRLHFNAPSMLQSMLPAAIMDSAKNTEYFVQAERSLLSCSSSSSTLK